ncbi:hypothetical protein H0H93_007508 [Arthromyces matolae]|nr:hypothetical protein H0H93_007508 [Arthromyces matolae]
MNGEVFIPVKLPPELSQLFRSYLLIIRPAEIIFAHFLWDAKIAGLYREYLYVTNGRKLEEQTFYGTFKGMTSEFFKSPIGVRAYRQMVITIARTYLGSEYELDVEEEETDSLIEQRNHGSAADRRCYGIQSQYLHTISSDVMFRFGRISEWWWQLTGWAPGKPPLLPLDIRRQHALGRQHHTRQEDLSVLPLSSPNIQPLASDSHIAEVLKITLRESLVPHLQHVIRQEVAMAFTEVTTQQNNHSQTLVSSTPSATVQQVAQQASITSAVSNNAVELLRSLYENPEARFRSIEQQLLVEDALQGIQNILGVLPTGGGKSLVFLLPAYADQCRAGNSSTYRICQKTITVIPNKALLSDMLRKALELGIRVVQWQTATSKAVSDNASLLLVALESITHPKFKEQSEGNIARICFDECHQMLTSEDYRTRFSQLGELAAFPVQRIFLSATLPPTLVQHFLIKNYLPNSTKVIRAPTFRANLRYLVLHVEERIRPVSEVAIDLARHLETTIFSPFSRGIIFCNAIAQVDSLAKDLKGLKSHSQMDNTERQRMQDIWFAGGQSKWMVATTGWLHGIDHPNVDAVIFTNLPYGLLNFSQGAGRAGRGGQEATIFLLHPTSQQWITPRESEIDVQLLNPVDEFLSATICHTRVLTEAMDGLENIKECNDILNGLSCNVCYPNHPLFLTAQSLLQPSVTAPSSQEHEAQQALSNVDVSPLPTSNIPIPSVAIQLDTARYTVLKKSKIGKVKELSAMTNMLQGHANIGNHCYCFICWAWKDSLIVKSASHTFFIHCKSKEDGYIKHGFGWVDLKKRIQFPKYKYCFRCGLPQGEFAPNSHPTFKAGEKNSCPFDDLVVVLCWYIINTPVIWHAACNTFSAITVTTPLNDIAKWLGKEESPQCFYNGLELVLWYWVTYKKDKPSQA